VKLDFLLEPGGLTEAERLGDQRNAPARIIF